MTIFEEGLAMKLSDAKWRYERNVYLLYAGEKLLASVRHEGNPKRWVCDILSGTGAWLGVRCGNSSLAAKRAARKTLKFFWKVTEGTKRRIK
jgi:hypothetical protein